MTDVDGEQLWKNNQQVMQLKKKWLSVNGVNRSNLHSVNSGHVC